MLQKINAFLSGMNGTLISGVFLLFSFILFLMQKNTIFDPAWITIFLSGFPMLYLAITRVILKNGFLPPF